MGGRGGGGGGKGGGGGGGGAGTATDAQKSRARGRINAAETNVNITNRKMQAVTNKLKQPGITKAAKTRLNKQFDKLSRMHTQRLQLLNNLKAIAGKS